MMDVKVPLVLAFWPALLSAQALPPVAPSGAQLLQQIEVPGQSAQPGTSKVSVDKTSGYGTGSPLPASVSFLLQRIQITHNTVFDTPTLLALVAQAEGQNTTLPELAELAGRITQHYRMHGYPLTRAIIPAQSISLATGVVLIRVVEARYSQIELANSSRVRDGLLQATLAPLASGQDVDDPSLTHVLLLLSDIPGVNVKAVFKPGAHDATSDLSMQITPSATVLGQVTSDNYGNAFTGQERVSGSFTVNNPWHQGDTFNVSVLSSGKGLNHGRVAYEATLNGLGTRAGAAYSSLAYALGGTYAPLHPNGNATLMSVWGKQPLIRSTNLNVYAQAQFDALDARDRINAPLALPDRASRSATLSLAGDAQGAAYAVSKEGSATWRLAWTGGRLEVGAHELQAGVPIKASARHFGKWNLSMSYLHRLSKSGWLYLSYAGQRAASNLDSSQKLSAGGPYTVRAYAMGAVTGDSGDVLSAEWQLTLGHGLQAVAFVDAARISLNHVSAAGPNTVFLRGAGVGLNWTGPSQWTVRSAIAKPLGTMSPLVAADKCYRAWLELRKAF